MRNHLLFLAAAFAALVLLAVFPAIDLAVSGAFFVDGRFAWRDLAVVQWVHRYGEWPALAVGIFALFALVCAFVRRRSSCLALDRRGAAFLVLVLVIGPGLIVNALLKEYAGRARPLQVQEFGGERQFTPVLRLADECRGNCSFPSGHASMGFYFIALALLARRRRGLAFAGALATGVAIGSVRIVQGGHFLSDVLAAFIVVYAVSLLLYRLLRPGAALTVRAAPTSGGS
ncbi:MAG: phosphatase PAP2 family protein [Chromatiales bacterium]|jgi:lipid A 4'-phosphatase|nr:phosphatase PAP2 family protein [Chromatiales bacterium]